MTVGPATVRRLTREAVALNGKHGDPRNAARPARKRARDRSRKPHTRSVDAKRARPGCGWNGSRRVVAGSAPRARQRGMRRVPRDAGGRGDRAIHGRLSARPHHVGRPTPGQRRMDARPSSPNGAGMPASRPTRSSFRRRRNDSSKWSRRQVQGGARRAGRAVDPTSGQKAEQLPTYNVYSIDGDVTGPLSTSTTGGPKTTRNSRPSASRSAARSSSPDRRIVPRHQAEDRGREGAVACLIYSDPRDDGYFGDRFPKGPMRN